MTNLQSWEEDFEKEFAYSNPIWADGIMNALPFIKNFIRHQKELSFQEGEDAREKELLDALDAVSWDEIRAARTQDPK